MNTEKILERLKVLYPKDYEEVLAKVELLIKKWQKHSFLSYSWVNETDVVLIGYGNAIQTKAQAPLHTLRRFAKDYLKGIINIIHILPMFPYTSDDGFSVSDFRAINPEFGTWEDVLALGEQFDLMFDAVINHVSVSSSYFKEYLNCNGKYRNFFITADPDGDYQMVTRPRVLPLLTPFETKEGVKYVWTTFSADQADLNYKEPEVLLEILDVLLLYAFKGARFIRFDAIGFAWKEMGTTCMHLPQTHELIKLTRDVLETFTKGLTIITETNVPHMDNISYFGNGHDEAGMVYQFPLPPLTLFSFLSGNTQKLSEWAASLAPTSADTTYFNFLASHDGIGIRPVEDILTAQEKEFMVTEVKKRGGQVSYRTMPGGQQTPYELNINYLDAVAGDLTEDEAIAKKFLASQCILLSVVGMPAIYYHSLLGSRNCYSDFEASGIKRRINREKLDYNQLTRELDDPGTLRNLVYTGYKKMIALRKQLPAFAPNAPQQVLSLDAKLFTIIRGEGSCKVLVVINVSADTLTVHTDYKGIDLFAGTNNQIKFDKTFDVLPFACHWIKLMDE